MWFYKCKQGLLEYVMSRREENLEPFEQLRIQVRWYEKLHKWDQALLHYEDFLETEPYNLEWSSGQMR